MDDFLNTRQHLIEHTLVIYTNNMAIVSPKLLYDPIPDEYSKNVIDTCHIYMIGIVPIAIIIDVQQRDNLLCYTFTVAGKKYENTPLFTLPPNSTLIKNALGEYWLLEQNRKCGVPQPYDILMAIKQFIAPFQFKILYIGQAFGEEGSRNAIDRLLSHSTLQKIALTEMVPESHRLEIILMGIENSFQLITGINPFAKDHNSSDARIANGNDMLFGTNEAQRISLYEAALIRYFQPKYNTHFKDSFPSTNLKVLDQCYNKDIQAVVAEINFKPFLYDLYSDVVSVSSEHIAHFDIHSEESRKSFFWPS